MHHGTTDQQPLLSPGMHGEARRQRDLGESTGQGSFDIEEPQTTLNPTAFHVDDVMERPNDSGRLEDDRLIENPEHTLSGDDTEQPRTDTPDGSTTMDERDDRTEAFKLNEDATWYPFWLRKSILIIFLGLFVSFTITLSFMLWYSSHNQGLFTVKPGFDLVWQFGPTAGKATNLLTIVAGFWARVELQAARYMPWIALCRGHMLKTADFDLDYLSMIMPTVLIQSFRRKHFTLFFVVAASLLIKIQIVLAPSLYRAVIIHTSQPVDVKLSDAFRESDIGPQDSFWDTDRSPFYTARAMLDFNMSYPFGVTGDFAYQRFSPRGTPNAPISVLVDGISASMHCLRLESFSVQNVTKGRGRKHFRQHDVDFTLDFEGCSNTPFRASLVTTPYSDEEVEEHWVINTTFSNPRPCGNLPQQDRQFIYFASNVTQSPQNRSRPEITSASGVICTPTLGISRVAILDHGVNPTASRASNETQLLHNTDFWKTLGESVDHQNSHNWAFHIWTFGGRNYGPVDVLSRLEGKPPQNGTTSQETTEIMYDAVMGLTKRLGPLIAHYRLRSKEDATVAGEQSVGVERLLVKSPIGLSMLAVFCLLISIVGYTLFWHRKDDRIYHRDPATLLGNLMFIRDRPKLIDQSLAHGKDPGRGWTRKSFVPFTLKTASRTAFTLIVLSVIAILAVTLERSESYHGVIATEGSWDLMWTSLPALAMLGIALYANSYDSALRGLSTLHSLASGSCNAQQLDSSMLDMLGFRAFGESIRSRVWSVTLSQTLALMCALLTTIASVIFQVESVPEQIGVQLQQNSWFGQKNVTMSVKSGDFVDAREYLDMLSSLLFRKGEGEFTYPKNTFDDLVFPAVGEVPPSVLDTARNASFDVTTPAARFTGSCKKLDDDAFKINVTSQRQSFKKQKKTVNSYTAHVSIPVTCLNESSATIKATHIVGNGLSPTNSSYFAGVLEPDFGYDCEPEIPRNLTPFFAPSLRQTYFWGSRDHTKQRFDFARIWVCDYSWVQVTAQTHMMMFGGELVLDQAKPPSFDPSDSTVWDPPFSSLQFTDTGVQVGFQLLLEEHGIDTRIFELLIQPYGSLPVEVFGDPTREQDILDALNYNRGFLTAQLANVESRLQVGESSFSMPFPAEGLAPLQAVVNRDRRKLVQNRTATCLLVGILGTVALVHLFTLLSTVLRRRFGWRRGLLDMDAKGLAPDGFGSISTTVALLSPSNAIQHMPSQKLSKEELLEQLSGLRFRLGWFRREQDQTRHFTIGVMGDSEFTFLGRERDSKERR